MLSVSLFAQLSLDAGERAALAHLLRLILVGRHVYGHLHAHRDGDSVRFPFYGTTLLATVKSAQSKTSTTVSVERNGVKYAILFGTNEEGTIHQTAMDSSRSN